MKRSIIKLLFLSTCFATALMCAGCDTENSTESSNSITTISQPVDLNRLTLDLKCNIEGAGICQGGGVYRYNTDVNISVTAAYGYVFEGWYYNDILLTRNEVYKHKMWNQNVVLEARFTQSPFILKVKSMKSEYGTVAINSNSALLPEQSSSIVWGSDVTIVAFTKTDMRFQGWFDVDDNLVSPNAVYTFKMPMNDYELEARWYNKINHLKLNKGYGISTIASTGRGYSYETMTVEATILDDSYYAFEGWFHGNDRVGDSLVYSFPMPDEDYELTARCISKTQKEYFENQILGGALRFEYNSCYYGCYPQSLITNEDLIYCLNQLSVPGLNGWYYYNQNYYAKVNATPHLYDWDDNSKARFNNGDYIIKDNVYWFLVEPIKWLIYLESGQQFYAVSEKLLDIEGFVAGGGIGQISAESYDTSNTRNALNTYFLENAFPMNKTYLQKRTIDNSATTGYDGSSGLDTEDYIFLPSYKFYTNDQLGFSTSDGKDPSRCCVSTEYARARGVWGHYLNNFYGCYSTRSIDHWVYGSYFVYVTSRGGLNDSSINGEQFGVRPAIICGLGGVASAWEGMIIY